VNLPINLGGEVLATLGLWVFLLDFFVNFLLTMGTNQLLGGACSLKNAVIAAVLGGIYSSLCLLPQLSFMGNPLIRMLCLAAMALIAFGHKGGAIFRAAVFVALRMAAGSITQTWEGVNPWLLLSVSVIVLCFSSAGLPQRQNYVPVELNYGKRKLCLTALRDTGNTLRDPVTGKPVLVVGADAAQKLTGLSAQQLRQPVETMGKLPGLRLIPYKAIGGSGLLLALYIPQVRIGAWSGGGVVAFAPEVLNINGTYQALTGGMV